MGKSRRFMLVNTVWRATETADPTRRIMSVFALYFREHISKVISVKNEARKPRELMAKSQTGKKASAEARERMAKAQQARCGKGQKFHLRAAFFVSSLGRPTAHGPSSGLHSHPD